MQEYSYFLQHFFQTAKRKEMLKNAQLESKGSDHFKLLNFTTQLQ